MGGSNLKRYFRASVFLTVLVAAGCSGSTSPLCTAEFRFGLSVYVNDSVTNAPIASGASLVARDGSFADSVTFPSSRPDLDALPLVSAGEREGTYQISVLKPGYLSWSRSNLLITRNECHVNPVRLTALLRRAN